MLPDRVSNPGTLTYQSDALPTALRGPAHDNKTLRIHIKCDFAYSFVKFFCHFARETTTMTSCLPPLI